MASAGVVEGLEVVEDRQLRLVVAGEPSAGLLLEQLALQGREHALGEAVGRSLIHSGCAGGLGLGPGAGAVAVGSLLWMLASRGPIEEYRETRWPGVGDWR